MKSKTTTTPGGESTFTEAIRKTGEWIEEHRKYCHVRGCSVCHPEENSDLIRVRLAEVEKERDEARKNLKNLGVAIDEYVVELDEIMKGPSSYDRGRKMAVLVSALLATKEDLCGKVTK